MRALSQTLVRSIRIGVDLDKTIQDIARLEDRTVSNIIQHFLRDSVNRYLDEHPDSYDRLHEIDMAEKQRLMSQALYGTSDYEQIRKIQAMTEKDS